MGSLVTEDTASFDENVLAILDACERGDVKRLGEFIISGGELKDHLDARGRTALHHCVKCRGGRVPEPPRNVFEQLDRIKCARIIVKTDSSFLSQLDAEGQSPMHLAVLNNDVEFVRAMLEFRPSLGTKTQDMSGSQGTSTGSQTTLSSVIGGRTVLHLAVLHAHIEILKLLLELDAKSCINASDGQGATALHYAVQLSGHAATEAIEILVEKGKADLNMQDSHGRTPLSWAATIGASEAVTELLKLGAKLNVTDECGLTALHCAASRGNQAIVQCMLNWISVANMDDPSKTAAFRDVADNDGCSPLFYSVTMGHYEVTKCLLEYGANVKVTDAKGRSLAHCLARLGATTATDDQSLSQQADKLHLQMTALLQAGLDPWSTTNTGAAPLHEACLLRNVPFVRELTRLPAFRQHVDERDAQGHTALHLVVAASWSSDAAGLELCECLLANGANVNLSTLLPQGGVVTALDLAILNEKEEKVVRGKLRSLLEANGAKTFGEISKMKKSTDKDHVDGDELIRNKSHTPTISKSGIKNQGTMDDGPVSSANERFKCASTMTDEFAFGRDRVKGHANTTPRPGRPLIHSEAKRELKTQVQSVQTTRSSQTDFEFATVPGARRPEAESLRVSQKEEPIDVGIQFEHPGTRESQTRHKEDSSHSNESRCSSKPSIHNSSASVRVNTPLSSTPEPEVRPQKSGSKRASNRVNSSPSNSRHQPPYSQAYLERELPGILRRYLSQEDKLVSPLTGRSRMPKPTLSPYLIPLVPYTNPMMTISQKHTATVARKPIPSSYGSPKRKPLVASNENRMIARDSRHRTPVKTTATRSGIGAYRTNSAPQSKTNRPTDQQIIAQLVRESLAHIEARARYVNRSEPADLNRARKSKSKVRANSGGGAGGGCGGTGPKTRSAMGGELSPVGVRDHSDHTETILHSASAKRLPTRPGAVKKLPYRKNSFD